MTKHDPEQYERCRVEEAIVKWGLSLFFSGYLAGIAVFVLKTGDF